MLDGDHLPLHPHFNKSEKVKGVIFAFLYVSQLKLKAHLVVFLLRLVRWSSLPASGLLRCHRPLQVSDLLDQIVLLVTELLVL